MADLTATLADPTDYGNKPGDGPLRQGGRPGGVAVSDADKPSTRSPRSAAQQEGLAVVRTLWGGIEELRRQAGRFLPRAPGEDAANYLSRLNRTAFFNAFRRSVEGLAGLAFSTDPKLGDDVPEVIVEQWENIDNAGTHGDVFCRQLLIDDLIDGHTAVLVEFPRTGGQQNALSEMTGEVRPYWVPIRKHDIMSWRTEVVDGRTVLAQLVVRECTYEPTGAFGEAEVERYRVLFRAPGGIVGWRLLRVTKENTVVVDDEGLYPTQDEIPVAEIVSAGHKSMFDSDPPLLDLAHLNVAHYQMWSDYNWSIHKTCVPFIFGSGIAQARDDNGQPIPLTVGANTAVLVPESGASMGYVSHSGESLGSVKAALDDLKNDMGTLALAMLAPQKRSAETAEAKRLDKATSDSSLSTTVRGLQDGVERALYFHARYLRLDDGGSVEFNRDYEGLMMDAPVMGAFATLVQAGFPPMPVLEALQRGGRIDDDADLEALEMDWLMGMRAKQMAAEAMAEGFAGGNEGEPKEEGEARVDIERDEFGRVARLVKRGRNGTS